MKIFEIVDDDVRIMTNRQMPEHGYTISSPMSLWARFFLFSGSRVSLPYFSENPNKNKSAFGQV